MVLEYIHQFGFVQTNHIIIYHGLAHHLINITEGTGERLSLNKIGNIAALLLLTLLINRDELEFSLIPLIIIIHIAEEDFAVASLADTAHLQLAAYINRHLIDDSALSLGKAQSIYYVCFRNNLF